MKLIISKLQGKGKRTLNQDWLSTFVSPKGCAMVVCDGLGHYSSSGEVAKSCANAFTSAFNNLVGSGKKRLVTPLTARHCLGVASHSVLYQKRLLNITDKSSTTIAGILTDGNQAVFINLGDTRIYRFRDNKIAFVTLDHSLAQRHVDKEKISRYEIVDHPDQNKLTKSIGGDSSSDPDITLVTDLRAGDSFLICTDGFWTAVSEREMEEVLAKSGSASYALRTFEKYITSHNIKNQDNFSAILCKFVD